MSVKSGNPLSILKLHLHEGGGFTLSNYSQFFTNPSYWQAMVNSLEVTAIVTLLSVLLAYPFAWILAEQVPERWQRLALMLAVLPFWTSYVVRSYSWLLVLAQNGVINRALTGSGLITEPVQLANTRLATVTGFVHFFVMGESTILAGKVAEAGDRTSTVSTPAGPVLVRGALPVGSAVALAIRPEHLMARKRSG